jgi:saccharopine dehydrogenase-like NADP-dependent oxidoreductase
MKHSPRRALIIGCHGGVGYAVLALLQHSAAGQRLREQLDAILLVDRELPDRPVPLEQGVLLPPTTIGSADDLARLVREHHITEVIDLSSIDTLDCTRACDELGADFLCTSVEEWPWRGSIPTDEAIMRLIPPQRPELSRRSHLVGSGANPGIVNALAFAAIEEFARRAGVAPTPEALQLHAILITEDDTTAARDAPQGDDVFAMTWSPAHCLEELFEPRAFVARHGIVAGLGHAPTERRYRARCGDRFIDGMAVPHEETVTLARLLPDVEIAFIY